MTGQLFEFSIKHIGLISAAIAIIGALGIIAHLQWLWGSRALSPTGVTLLLNRGRAKILDLREKKEFVKAHLPHAIHVAQWSQEALLNQFKPRQSLIFITSESIPPFQLLKQLRQAGFSELYHLEGGIETWRHARLPLQHSLET